MTDGSWTAFRPFLAWVGALVASAAPALADDSAEYRRVVEGRAAKIVDQIGVADSAQRDRVVSLIADQYAALSAVHDARDEKIDGASDSERQSLEDASHREVVVSHRRFVAALAAELAPAQVEAVKDGMTYNVAPNTYAVYLKMLPDLSDDLKRMIHANLLEAREHAMDAGSSKEKHGWFGKYKGRINNQLSAAGYDLKQAEKDMFAREASRKAQGASSTN